MLSYLKLITLQQITPPGGPLRWLIAWSYYNPTYRAPITPFITGFWAHLVE